MTSLAVDLVLNPVDATWAQILTVARRAASQGYQGLWVLDHVSGAPFGAETTGECCTLLGALAVTVPELPLGPLVLNAAARPVALAGLAMETLARLAGDRLRIGVGAGAGRSGMFAVEHEVLGRPAPPLADRHARVAELIGDLRARALLGATPVIVGANSVALARLAGELADGLNVGVDRADRDVLIDAALTAARGRSVEISAWARWRPELVDPTSEVRRSLTMAGVTRLMVAVRPCELSA